MNYFYIDYMIQERRREELEACERRRLLKSAGYSRKGLRRSVGDLLSSALQSLKQLRMVPPKGLYTTFSMVHGSVHKKGGRR
jgi:hypothetical protein